MSRIRIMSSVRIRVRVRVKIVQDEIVKVNSHLLHSIKAIHLTLN